VFFWFSIDCFVFVLFACVVLGLVSSVLSQEIGKEECLGNDLYCVEWDVKPHRSQSLTKTNTPFWFLDHRTIKVMHERKKKPTPVTLSIAPAANIKRLGSWNRVLTADRNITLPFRSPLVVVVTSPRWRRPGDCRGGINLFASWRQATQDGEASTSSNEDDKFRRRQHHALSDTQIDQRRRTEEKTNGVPRNLGLRRPKP